MPLQFFMRSDTFATAAQVSAADFEEIARLGYKTVINNRPDGEGGDKGNGRTCANTHHRLKLRVVVASCGICPAYIYILRGDYVFVC